MITKLITGIKNLIKWFPIIWNDKQWDYYYFYKILYHKLKLMEEFWKSDEPVSAKTEKTAKQIMIAKNLAKRLMENNYLDNALMWHKQKYPDYLDKALSIVPYKDNPKIYMYVDKNPVDAQESFRRCGKHADYMEKQDKDMLFNLLKKYIERWWD
jgi:hypothetical protein